MYAQRPREIKESTTIFDERLDKSFKDGEAGFARHVGLTLVYPLEARTNGVMGLSVFSFKVGCDNRPYAFNFRTKLGFGIEQEIERVIKKTKGDWLACSERDTLGPINYRIAFTINNLYDSEDAFLQLSANGDFPQEFGRYSSRSGLSPSQRTRVSSRKISLSSRFRRGRWFPPGNRSTAPLP